MQGHLVFEFSPAESQRLQRPGTIRGPPPRSGAACRASEPIVPSMPLYRPMRLPTGITELLQHDRCADDRAGRICPKLRSLTSLTSAAGAKPFTDHLSHMLHQRTNGNPLFLITVVNTLVSQGILEETARAWRLQGGYETIAGIVPDSLRLLIERYVEQLPPEDQTILEAASVTGQTFGQRQQAHAALCRRYGNVLRYGHNLLGAPGGGGTGAGRASIRPMLHG